MAAKKKTVSNVVIDLQSGTTNLIYATWEWSQKNTKEYNLEWYYRNSKDDVWFLGTKTTSQVKQATYSAPDNTQKVKVKIKPIAKTHTVKKKSVAYWTADWTSKTYNFSNNPPVKPSVPSVKIEKYKLTAEVDDYNSSNKSIEFYVVSDDNKKFTSCVVKKVTNHAAFSCSVTAGKKYKVRCRGIRDNEVSDWSEYSANVETIPSAVSAITSCEAISSTSVRINWDKVGNAKTYNVEYTSDKTWFDTSDQTSTMSVNTNTANITGLESGKTWYFRVQAVNEQGESGWSSISSVVLGKTPSAPTTWSSTTTAVVGEDVTLYWVHNSADNSSQTYAQLELTVNGASTITTIQNSTDEDEKDKTSYFQLSTSVYTEGTKIQWRVRTRGVTDTYSDWSIQREVTVYAKPVLSVSIRDIAGAAIDQIVTGFPICVYMSAGPANQTAIEYAIAIVANESYQTVDYTGEEKWVNKDEEVYSKVFDASSNTISIVIYPSDVNLDNDISYSVKCTVSMNSGLTAEATRTFTTAWSDDEYVPDAEIGIDDDTVSAYIRPFCEDENGDLIEDVTLSVYRREFDGELTELASDLENNSVYIVDPHPALNYARYRIVSKSKTTGKIGFYDTPNYPVGETAIIIQWDESWSSFDTEDETEEVPWTGSFLRLPYNIDTSEETSQDVSLVEYIGRKHPVAYHGTQIGETSTWNVDVPETDEETVYALRRLMKWMGAAYVREPSGVGYWASVTVSMSRKHCGLVIPVTLKITRVEGGV